MSEEELLAGSDMIHGEAPYVFGPCEAHEHLVAGHYVKRPEAGPGELELGGLILGQESHAPNNSGSGTEEPKKD
jgi:ammonium transporter, Amt family